MFNIQFNLQCCSLRRDNRPSHLMLLLTHSLPLETSQHLILTSWFQCFFFY